MRIIAVDIEASGMNPFVHSILEIGAVCLDTDTLEVVSRFEVNIKDRDGARWEPRCLREFWTNPENCETRVVHALLERIEQAGVAPKAAIEQFWAWLQAQHTAGHPVKQIVSDNVAFDVAWLDHELLKHGVSDQPLAYAFCSFDGETGAAGGRQYKQARSLTDLMKGACRQNGWVRDETLFAALGVAAEDTPEARGLVHDHRAVNDAHKMAHVYALIVRAFQKE